MSGENDGEKNGSLTGNSKPSAQLQQRQSRPRSVSFDAIQINEFPVIIGDNPASNGGASLSIGWNSFSRQTVSLDLYESTRKPKKKDANSLVLSESRRHRRLRGAGFTDDQIQRAAEAADKIRLSRRHSAPSKSFGSGFGSGNSSNGWSLKTMRKILGATSA